MKQITQKTKKFLDPEKLLREVPLEPGMVVADFGSGNGYYSVASGKLVGSKGQVHAIDILENALSQTATLAKITGLNNVSTHECNLEKLGSCPVDDTVCDLVIISSLLHQSDNPDNIFREAYRVLKTGGKLLVVEWLIDAPLGPPVNERVAKQEAEKLIEKYSFRPVHEIPAGSFHYALLYSK